MRSGAQALRAPRAAGASTARSRSSRPARRACRGCRASTPTPARRPTTSSSRWRSGSSARTGWPSTWRAPIAAASSASSSEPAAPRSGSARRRERGGGRRRDDARRARAAQRRGKHRFGRRRRVVEQERCADRDGEHEPHDHDGSACGEAADDAGAVFGHDRLPAGAAHAGGGTRKGPGGDVRPGNRTRRAGWRKAIRAGVGAGVFRSHVPEVHALTIPRGRRGGSGAFGPARAEYSRSGRCQGCRACAAGRVMARACFVL